MSTTSGSYDFLLKELQSSKVYYILYDIIRRGGKKRENRAPSQPNPPG
jgi:hypothetical protein